LRAGAQALARVHVAWRRDNAMASTCPAITRRLDAVAAWRAGTLLRSVSNQRLADAVSRWMPRVPELLRDVAFPVRLQPCLRDVWHDHLLFEGDRLTGLVDYAAVGVDSVAADLARMLGSLVADDEEGWQVGLAAYREVTALTTEEERLSRRLDRTGVVVSLATWLRWTGEGRRWFDEAGTSRRVEELLARVERWAIG
jgi:Ser/Thr protein kinase RdoA (MazF antagonist)